MKETLERMQAAGYAAADWVNDMLQAGIESFYRYKNGEKVGVYDVNRKAYVDIMRPEGVVILRQEKVVSQNQAQLYATWVRALDAWSSIPR